MSNGHLVVKIRNGVRVKSNEEIIVNISAPTADYLHLSGTGDLMVTGNLIAANLDMGISGTGNITVPSVTITDKLHANISGSGNITVQSGVAKNEDLRISGSGKLFIDRVVAEKSNHHYKWLW